MKNVDGVSVVVCCYNSASRLGDTIKHLGKQIINPGFGWELIVVDNNSSDNTIQVAQTEAAKYPVLAEKFIVIQEPEPGLNFARHAGVTKAKYEYIIFCDDDNHFNSNYINRCNFLLNEYPEVGVVGGLGQAISSQALPLWFYTYQHFYAVGSQSLYSGILSKRNYLFGAGMAFRKSVYERIAEANFAYLTTDRKGAELSSGGDVELCYIHLLIGYKLYYDEELTFLHFMSPNRLTKDYLERLMKANLGSAALLNGYMIWLNHRRMPLIKRAGASAVSLLKLMYQFIRRDTIYKLQLDQLEALHILPFILFSKKISSIRDAVQRYHKLVSIGRTNE